MTKTTNEEKSIGEVVVALRKEEEENKQPSISDQFEVDVDNMRRRHVTQLEKEEAEARVAEQYAIEAQQRAAEARKRAAQCVEAIKRIDMLREV